MSHPAGPERKPFSARDARTRQLVFSHTASPKTRRAYGSTSLPLTRVTVSIRTFVLVKQVNFGHMAPPVCSIGTFVLVMQVNVGFILVKQVNFGHMAPRA